jgi:lipid A 3-O-deacylase
LTRFAKFFLSTFAVAIVLISGHGIAQAQNGVNVDPALNPVAEARDKQLWEMGPFLNYGQGVGERSDFYFLWGGFQLGKTLTPLVHAGIFSGQFEFGGNIQPLWIAFTPAPHYEASSSSYECGTVGLTAPCQLPIGGGNYHGVSIMPVIFRWNFHTRSRRIQPWFQAAGGLIYTTHKFPPDVLVPHGVSGGTSVWNFSPQGGGGIHYFTRSRRSVDFGINAVHISSASLGDRNPGVNASVQFQVGYTFWK